MTSGDEIPYFHALLAVVIESLAAHMYMVGIQYFLLKIHTARPNAKSPDSAELGLLITGLWILHYVLDTLLAFTIDSIVLVVSPPENLGTYRKSRRDTYSIASWTRYNTEPSPVWDGLLLLWYEILVTWIIHRTITLITDTFIPLFLSTVRNPHLFLPRFQARTLELLAFFQTLHHPPTRPVRPQLGKLRSGHNQIITLKRHHDSSPIGGQRTLSWDLTVDKHALDEMKETLGPPGGFGELGFSVAENRVCFGAMGVGTRFDLTFMLDEQGFRKVVGVEDGRRRSWMH